jgi:cobalt-zinc-cadmium efflux system protein
MSAGHHGHAHDEGTAGRTGRIDAATRPLALAVALTLGYAVVEALGGLWTGSLALLADAGHMVTDSAALLFALGAHLIARRPASQRHSFGLARLEVIAAFVNALAMLAVVGWIFVEAIQRIQTPVAVKGLEVVGIAAIGLLVNLLVAWLLSRDRANINTRAAFIHVLGDLLGSVAAIAAGLIIQLGGPVLVDPLLSLLVGGLILRSTVGVLRESIFVLLDSVPPELELPRIGQALARLPGVVSVHDLHVWTIAPGRAALSAHVLVEDFEQWPAVLHRARSTLLREFGIEHVTLQPERLLRPVRANVIPVEPHHG